VDLAKDYQEKGVAIVAISSNSIKTHPQDGPEQMAVDAREQGRNLLPASMRCFHRSKLLVCSARLLWSYIEAKAVRVRNWRNRSFVCTIPDAPCRLYLSISV